MPAVVVLNSFVNVSREPQRSTMAFLRGPSWSAPPWPLRSLAEGARFFQKREWLMWPIYKLRHDKIKRACQVECQWAASQRSARKERRTIGPRAGKMNFFFFTYHHH